MSTDPMTDADGVPCPPTPEQEEGPYYRREHLEQSDITEGRSGEALALNITVTDSNCVPVSGTVVDIWHCDALGIYSWYAAEGEREDDDVALPVQGTSLHGCEGAGLVPGTFLRGWQRTDDAGSCRFQTIYPGWYPGRAVHIHLKAYRDDQLLTTQLYFPDELTDAVHALEPYNRRSGRDTSNPVDTIFSGEGGEATMLRPIAAGDGYVAEITITVG